MKTISIAMATYNGAAYISEQLESLAQQTLLPSELVITDDGSTDDTWAIIAEFAKRSPFPVRVERNELNLGFRKNFMKAASLCKGDFIAFCDQDDVWFPHKLKICFEAFETYDTLLVYHNATVVSESLRPIDTLRHVAAPKVINYNLTLDSFQFSLGFTLVFHRMLLDFMDLWIESSDFYVVNVLEAHDQWYFFLPASLGIVRYVAEPLAFYRRHEGNTTEMDKADSLQKKWKNLLATNLDGIMSREVCARRRSIIMHKISTRVSEPFIQRALEAANYYAQSADRYKARITLYTTPNIFSRFRQLIKLFASGGYRPRSKWGVGHKALVRDIICGVLFPKRD